MKAKAVEVNMADAGLPGADASNWKDVCRVLCEQISSHYSASLDYQPPYVAVARDLLRQMQAFDFQAAYGRHMTPEERAAYGWP